MDDLDLLAGVMDRTAELVEGVRPEQHRLPTPCTEWDVGTLVGHLVTWVQVFEAAANGVTYEGDLAPAPVTPDAGQRFRASATGLVDGWRRLGTDRTTRVTSGELPADAVLSMTLMEYVTHGWDLATATGQEPGFGDEAAARTLERAHATLQPQYRGSGTAMGEPVVASDDAPPLVRLVAFLGRDPFWG